MRDVLLFRDPARAHGHGKNKKKHAPWRRAGLMRTALPLGRATSCPWTTCCSCCRWRRAWISAAQRLSELGAGLRCFSVAVCPPRGGRGKSGLAAVKGYRWCWVACSGAAMR